MEDIGDTEGLKPAKWYFSQITDLVLELNELGFGPNEVLDLLEEKIKSLESEKKS